MRITKPMTKKLIGYLASIICLVFLGEPFLGELGTIIQVTSEAQP